MGIRNLCEYKCDLCLKRIYEESQPKDWLIVAVNDSFQDKCVCKDCLDIISKNRDKK